MCLRRVNTSSDKVKVYDFEVVKYCVPKELLSQTGGVTVVVNLLCTFLPSWFVTGTVE